MSKKRLISLMVVLLLLLSTTGTAIWAYYSDAETSGSQLVSGTLDLKTNDADGVSQSLYAIIIKPGGTVGPSTISLKNVGSVNGSILYIVFTYVENDSVPNSINKTADETAAKIEVLTLSLDGCDISVSMTDTNGNGYKDIQDLKDGGIGMQSGIDANLTKDFVITVQLRPETGNEFQADGINMTITFTLNQ